MLIALEYRLSCRTFPGLRAEVRPSPSNQCNSIAAFRFPELNRRNRMESAFRNTWTYLLLAFAVLALSVGAFAQGGAGELTGLVTDSTGAVVSGVEVKLSNTATGEVRTTVTTPAG